jgi:peptidoglycan DL-endopeptidase LytF
VGVDSATLAALNAIDNVNLVVAGQSLKLPGSSGAPASAPAPTAAPASSARTYTVAAGDTLWSVAQQLGTTTTALVDANHLDDPDHLVAGAQLALPGGVTATAASQTPSTTVTAPPATPPAQPAQPALPAPATAASPKRSLLVSYTVQTGETLSQIAHQFDAPADAIAQASGLDDPNRLSIGTVLKVPLPGREHVVQAGETLRDIAAQEKVDLGSLIDFNTLDDPQLIRVGQVVMVPAPATGQTAASNNPPPPKPAALGPAPAPAQASTAPAASTASVAGVLAPASTTVSAAPAPSTAPAPKPAAASPASAQPAPAQPAAKPAAPIAVVAPPTGSPTDGLAGAGLKLLGAPYVWGGSNPSGFDCSGFVWYVARQAGKQLSRGMLGEYNAGPHPARDELKPGDLVFFQNTYSAGLSHNGIYVGNGQFVHAADEAAGVTVSSLGTAYWSSHWFGATRLP